MEQKEWLEKIFGELILFFSKKKYSNLRNKNGGGGGGGSTCFRKKLLNFAHHYEFWIKNSSKNLSRKKGYVRFDQRGYKWSSTSYVFSLILSSSFSFF